MEDSATSVPPSVWTSLNSWFTSTVFFVLLNLMIATIVFTSNLPSTTTTTNQQQDEHQKQNSHNDDDRNQPEIVRSSSILHRLKSFNFYPQRSQDELSPEHHHHEPLEIAATEYVFNQTLHYQHFDFDTINSDETSQITNAGDQFSSFNQTHEVRDSETRIVWEKEQQAVESMVTHFDFDQTHEDIHKDSLFEDAHEDEDEHTDEFQSLDEVYSRLKGEHVNRTKSDGKIPPKPPAKVKRSASLKVGFAHLEEEEIVEARRPATVRERKSAAREVEHDDVEVDAKADDFINKFKNDLKLQRIESIIRTKGAK